MRIHSVIIMMLAVFIIGCGLFGKKDYQWTDLPDEYYAIPVYAQYLNGFSIVLDPGHGGQADVPGFKRGPHGVREAEMNLRVAFHLRDFLEKSGVKVYFTRTDDSFISLEDRAQYANTCGADFMVSLHHNATGNPEINYASVYYHNDPDFSPASIDIGRNIYFGLTDALHLPQVSPDGLHSDQTIYPAGFGLLRRMEIPAVLLESSFYSNFIEEERLNEDDYNKREAYGIFLGLARYAAGGIPGAHLVEPQNAFTRDKNARITFSISDGFRERRPNEFRRLRIFTDALGATLDGNTVPFYFDRQSEMLAVTPTEPLDNGEHTVELQLINMFKNHNWPHKFEFIVASPVRFIQFQPALESFPRGAVGFLPVDILFRDSDSTSVWDGTPWHVSAEGAQVVLADSQLYHGEQRIYVVPDSNREYITLTAAADSVSQSQRINLPQSGLIVFEGEVVSTMNDSLIDGVEVINADTLLTKSQWDGRFITADLPVGTHQLRFEKNGFEPQNIEITMPDFGLLRQDISLQPVDSALFFQREAVIDARFDSDGDGGTFNDSVTIAEINFEVTRKLLERLTRAGARISGVRDSLTQVMNVEQRIAAVNGLPGVWYLRIDISPSDSASASCDIYPGSVRGRAISEAILKKFAVAGYRTEIREGLRIPEVRNTNKTAIALGIKTSPQTLPENIVEKIYTGLRDFYRQMEEEAQQAKQEKQE